MVEQDIDKSEGMGLLREKEGGEGKLCRHGGRWAWVALASGHLASWDFRPLVF